MRDSVFEPLGREATVERVCEEMRRLYVRDRIPWVVGYSGGKDSTAALELVWTALRGLAPEDRKKPVHVIATNTGVESPLVERWVEGSLRRMARAAERDGVPVVPNSLRPALEDSFWVNLIGRGYAAPRPLFRWCTERLKIRPAHRFIETLVHAHGESILVLGIRKAESAARRRAMERHEAGRVEARLSPNANLANSWIYSPIEDWTNDDVWEFLMHRESAWGQSHDALLRFYMGATPDGECPLVLDAGTPSCGSSRFGCWVCTMVDRDRSLEALIANEGHEWLRPLLEFRNELDPRNQRGIPDDRERRDWRRTNGRVNLYWRKGERGDRVLDVIPGPYTRAWRRRWLRRLLETQEAVRRQAPEAFQPIRLITEEELREIRRIWWEEKRERDNTVESIFEAVTGRPWPEVDWERPRSRIDTEILDAVCGEDALHRELVERLLAVEEDFSAKGVRRGVFQALEEAFAVAGFGSRDEAVAEAKERWMLRHGGHGARDQSAA